MKRRSPAPSTTPLFLGDVRFRTAFPRWPIQLRANTPEAWDALMRDLDAGFAAARLYRR
jgi:hypothetical protein